MANLGGIDAALGPLPPATKAPIKSAFEYVLKNLSLGAMEHGTIATNLQAVWLSGTTSTTANQEFSIPHGLERTPTFALPVLALQAVNTQTPVLSVTRAADDRRVYFSAASTGVAIAVLVG